MKQILQRSQPDFTQEFYLQTDASNKAIGALLLQKNNETNKLMLIYAWSRVLSPCETNYSTTDKELCAIVKSVEHFRHYLLGKKFKLLTDHRSLEYLWNSKNLNSRLTRWSLTLQEYDFSVHYIPGETNGADGVSRHCFFIQEDETGNNGICHIQNEVDKSKILQDYHTASGHGRQKTMQYTISQKYSWPNMNQDIKSYLRKCITCLKSGGPNVNTNNKIIQTNKINELWEIDLIGKLCTTERGNKFIMIVIDHYSKRVKSSAIPDKQASTITNNLAIIINKMGIPKKILTDHGLEFNNNILKTFCSDYGIEIIFASPKHHQTMGLVERTNKTFFQKLQKINNFSNENWDERTKEATNSINNSYNTVLMTTPYIFRYGRTPTLPCDLTYNKNTIEFCKADLVTKRDQNFVEYAKKYIQKGRIKASEDYKIGDNVLLFREDSTDKFYTNWLEGFIIKEIINPTTYVITNGCKEIRANKIHIKMDYSKNDKGSKTEEEGKGMMS